MKSFGDVRQLAFLTDNIDTAMASWQEKSGVGPFTCYRNLTLPCHYKGELRLVLMDVGIAFRGDVQIEIIQQKNDVLSPYTDFIEKGQMGFHHMAYFCDDIHEAIAKAKSQGFDVISTTEGVTGQYAYFQDPNMPEILYEFMEIKGGLLTFFEDSIQKAKDWDGTPKIDNFDMSGV